MKTISENRSFGGTQGVYTHLSDACSCEMTFAVFLPEEARDGPVPVLWFLSGLTCTHENAMTKAGAQQWAAEQGVALVFPDTSPRGEGVPDDDAYDMGQGAGFYLDATEEPWRGNYHMWNYISRELPDLLGEKLPLDMTRQSIMGHSMGGHGAFVMAMSLPGRFRSASAIAPICNPMKSDWGRRQFTAYLGPEEGGWSRYDSTRLMELNGFDGPMLLDTGTDDQFWDKLGTDAFAAAATARRQDLTLRLRKGYNHSYFAVASVIEDHVAFHAEALWA